MLGLSGGKLRWLMHCFSGALIMTHPHGSQCNSETWRQNPLSEPSEDRACIRSGCICPFSTPARCTVQIKRELSDRANNLTLTVKLWVFLFLPAPRQQMCLHMPNLFLMAILRWWLQRRQACVHCVCQMRRVTWSAVSCLNEGY